MRWTACAVRARPRTLTSVSQKIKQIVFKYNKKNLFVFEKKLLISSPKIEEEIPRK